MLNNKYVSNFQKDKKPSCQTNNDTSKNKVKDHDQILSEVTKSSNTNVPFDTPVNRLTSNETPSLDKPINNSNGEEKIISPTNNPRETESQLVTSSKQLMKVIKTPKCFIKLTR